MRQEANTPKQPPARVLLFLLNNYILCPRTGRIFSKVKKTLLGSVSNGSPVHDGYPRIFTQGLTLKKHHVSWFLYYKRWPRRQLDHKNGDKENCAPWNLEEVTNAENQKRRNANLRRRQK